MTEKLKKIRRDLHQIPELAFDLFLTHDYIKNILSKLNLELEVVAKTGFIAYRRGESLDAIAFRSDMDALPVTEMTDVSFKSKHEGMMHACGHDGHMTMLLGFAHYISSLKSLKKSVVLIFQPAEEGPGGAKIICDAGIFEKYHIKHVFGIHLYPNLDEGKYGLVNGPMMAHNSEFDLEIIGQSAHAAQPHLGRDAILAASHLISSYHTIVSRFINPLKSGVLTVGTIHGGEARNIISNHVKISGTIRSFHDETHDTITTKMRDIDQAIEKAFDVKINNHIKDYYPVVHNDSDLFHQLKDALDDTSYVLIEPMMAAEDFAFYQKKVPGVFVMLGTKNESLGYTHPLHSCYFNFDEKVLIKGVELYQTISHMLNIY
ncbi:MAG: amidohydrolase [Acholeplasmataceae bacterium]|jgi:hippurate hydrolase|nr:amidohydrolase [Acholeplasmataceae bacterium]